jgi:hypothetical protein
MISVHLSCQRNNIDIIFFLCVVVIDSKIFFLNVAIEISLPSHKLSTTGGSEKNERESKRRNRNA